MSDHEYTIEQQIQPQQENKQVRVKHTWTEERHEFFNVAELEQQVKDCDRQVESVNIHKAVLEAKIKEAEKAINA